MKVIVILLIGMIILNFLVEGYLAVKNKRTKIGAWPGLGTANVYGKTAVTIGIGYIVAALIFLIALIEYDF